MIEEKLDNILDGVDLGEDYVLVYKDYENVLKDIDFANDEERLLTRAIIKNLEHEASKQFLKELAVDIPYIGVAQRNLLRKSIVASYHELKEARETLPEEEYKEFRDNLIKQKKFEINNTELQRRIEKENRNKNYKLWIKLAKKHGVSYANFYIYLHKDLYVVEFNQELNDAYVEAYSD